MNQRYGRVVVLYGGVSAEREVSLRTGKAVLDALQRQGIAADGLDIGPHALSQLEQKPIDHAFIALHGKLGEDGVIQGVLEMLGIPYTGSGVLASALAMDKMRSKWLWQSQQLPIPPYRIVSSSVTREQLQSVVDELGTVLMVKPNAEGSSVGMSKVESVASLHEAILQAAKFDDTVIVERWMSGGEYTVGILDDEVLPSIRIETPRAFYDYEAKYHSNTTRYHCPSGLPADEEHALQALAKRAFQALGCRGWGRVDFMRDQNGQFRLLEVNTVPGMTATSLVPMAAKAHGLSFDELVLRILETALQGGSL